MKHTETKKTPAPVKMGGLDLSALDSVNLDDLTAAEAKAVATGEPLMVPMELVYEDPNNPRTEFDAADLEELANSIALEGIIQPITVRPRDERGYKIITGARRRRAAEIAAVATGKREIPVVVITNPLVDEFTQWNENTNRLDLKPMEAAQFIQRWVATGMTQAEVGRRMNLTRSRVTELMALITMPPRLKIAYETGQCVHSQLLYQLSKLYERHGDVINSFLDSGEEVTRPSIAALVRSFTAPSVPTKEHVESSPGSSMAASGADQSRAEGSNSGLSVRAKAKKTSVPREVNIVKLEQRLTETFGARTTIKTTEDNQRGSVTFRFTSLDELDGLLVRWKVPMETSTD